ncbi:hypothetical protein [Bacteroides acidifaciens]|uniref:hypothetical protein n=1 Tax=Bacteroides acidifaciens TaxID=85831 RepID=UPI0025A61CD2|nr:hypothetical protein [Bacteroides acidifaciens]
MTNLIISLCNTFGCAPKEKSVACRKAERHCLRDNGAKSSDGWSDGGENNLRRHQGTA